MKCILCDKKKGKRFCPAKNTHICPQCCGEKRVIEVDCPSDCTYLESGQAYHMLKKTIAQLRQENNPIQRRKVYETIQKFGSTLSELEAAIVKYAVELRSLKDQHVLEAVEMLVGTYRTEKKGVIYERSSSNPLVQSLFQDLRKLLEEKKREAKSGVRLRLEDILDCLEALEHSIRHQLGNDSGGDAYLIFIKRNHPDVVSAASPSASLIVSS